MTAELRQAYPLQWPTQQRRTTLGMRRAAAFKVDLAHARDGLVSELRLLGAKDVVVSTNMPIRRDGLLLANASEPSDPGVAVYFDRRVNPHEHPARWKPFVIACDTYSRVRFNLRAVSATVIALRSIQRHGASEMLEQAFTGFAALPPAPRGAPWWETLGLTDSASVDAIRATFRQLANEHHPDKGGSTEKMAAITCAYHEALRLRGAA